MNKNFAYVFIILIFLSFFNSACSDSELFGYETRTASDKNLYVTVEGAAKSTASPALFVSDPGLQAGDIEAVDESGAKYASVQVFTNLNTFSLKFKLASTRRLFLRFRELKTGRCFLQCYLGRVAAPSTSNTAITNAIIDPASTGIAIRLRDAIAGRAASAQESAAMSATVFSSYSRPAPAAVLDPSANIGDMASDPVYSNINSMARVSNEYVKAVNAVGAASLMLQNAAISANGNDLAVITQYINTAAENGTEFQSASSVTTALSRVINGVVLKNNTLKTSFESMNSTSSLKSFSLGTAAGLVTIDPRSTAAIDESKLSAALSATAAAYASEIGDVPYISNIRVGASDLYSMSGDGKVSQTSPVEVSKTPEFTVTFSQNVSLNSAYAGMRARITENVNSVIKYKYVSYGTKKQSGDYDWKDIFGSEPAITNNVMTFRVSESSPVKLAYPSGPAVVTIELLELSGFFSAARATVPAVFPGAISGSFTTVR